MKIVRYSIGKKKGYGVLSNKTIKCLKGNPFHSIQYSGITFKFDEVKLLAPSTPSKVVCLGLNYNSHATEFKSQLPESPLLFIKPSTAIIGPEENIIYPAMSHQVDYEGELGVVIKKKASHISPKQALNYVLGYTCFNDVTARDLQSKDGQWTRAKSFDTFAAFGPWIETEFNPADAVIETYLNGQLKQQSNTNNLIFPIEELVSFISQVMTLLPGDIIATGTPRGVGPMNPGDTVEIKITSIGTLKNHVK